MSKLAIVIASITLSVWAMASGTRDVALSQETLDALSPVTIELLADQSNSIHYLGTYQHCHVVGYIETAVAENDSGQPMMPWSHPVIWCLDKTLHPLDEDKLYPALNTEAYIPSAPELLIDANQTIQFAR